MSNESVTSRGLARWATALVAMGGLIVAWYLVDFHIQSAVGDTIGGALCGAHQAVDCASAVHSEYSTLFGIPIALLGVAFYVAVLGLIFFDRQSVREASDAFRPGAIAATTFGIGVIYSLFLAGISAFELGTLCPFCVMLYVVNILGLITASIWAGDKPHRLVLAQCKKPGDFFNGWTGFFAFAFAVALMAGNWVINAEITNRARQNDDVAEEIEIVDPAEYRVDDAPAKGPEDALVHIVEFSNFPCPYCKELAAVLDELSEEYEEEVRVEYRHFPIGSQEDGPAAARAAFCADEQGEFWAMHDRLFASAPEHEPEDLVGYADMVGLDMDAFAECIDSERARNRVDEDIAAGRRLGIQGTPTFFINGQRVEGLRSLEHLQEFVENEIAIAGE